MANRFILITLFLLLSAANIYIYLNRNDGYEYVQQSSYKDLYPNISKGISRITIEKDNDAVIDLKGYPSSLKWNVSCNDTIIAKDLSLPLHFLLRQNVNRYLLQANDSVTKNITIDLNYSPAEIYKAKASSIYTNYEIRYCSEPFITGDSNTINKWKDPLDYTDATEIKTVKQLLTDSFHIKPADSTVNKIKIIGSYIYQSIKQNMGVPADSLANYSTYKQFCLVKEGKAKIWCGNITDIFHLFATNAGIICRNIGLSGKREVFTLGDHAFNECFIPETGEWALVDLTQNILLLKDSDGKFLNTVNLYQLKKLNQTDNITMYSSGDSSIINGGYSNPDKKYLWQENEILYPHPNNPRTLYSFFNKFQRYAGVHPWLEVYNENHHYDNHLFYLKSFLLHAWILLGLIILVLYLFTKKSKT